jgi:hypothetical protein
MDEPDEPDETAEPAPPAASAGRALALAIGVGLAVGVCVMGLAYSIVVIPIYLLAQSDPNGLDRPFVRNALLRFALPLGLLVGTVAGVLVAVWYRRGGRLPTDRSWHVSDDPRYR